MLYLRLWSIVILMFLCINVFSQDTVLVIGETPFEFTYIENGGYERPGTVSQDSVEIRIRKSYWIGKREITWRQWEAFMGWDDGRNQPNHPARRFTWFQLNAFADTLSQHSGLKIRLPTEEEWEYACVLGLKDKIRKNPLDFMWVRENTQGIIQETGSNTSNDLGLFDLQGNVWEYTSSWFDPKVFLLEKSNNVIYSEKVRKGGSAVYPSSCATCFYRYQNPPEKGNGNIGGRLVLEMDFDKRKFKKYD